MIEGEVKFNDIPKGQELSQNPADMDRFLKDGVAVHGGEATAVNSNNPGQPLVEPFKLSLEQLNKVEKTEIPGMTSAEAKTENHKSILPTGLEATVVASKPDLKETNSPEKPEPNKTLPGSMMDLATGIVLPPKEGAQYDAVTGTFVSTGNAVAKVNPDIWPEFQRILGPRSLGTEPSQYNTDKMKKIIFGVAMAVLLVCATANAQTFVNGSGSNSTDALIWTGDVNFQGILLATDGTNACTVSVYDNTSAAGTLLMPTTVVPTSATDRSRGFYFNLPVRANTGLYVDITCSGTCSYVVYTTR
jgi:hypothetical protein